VQFVVCEPSRLVYAPLPKCASTTMIAFLTRLGSSRERSNPRDCPRRPAAGLTPGQGGTYQVVCPSDLLPGFADRFRGFTWFSVVREPFSRVESNYHNKLNRFARRFHPLTYLRSYAGPLNDDSPDRRWQDVRIRRMQRTIGFDQFVLGLERHGIDWDLHYRPQSRMLRLERLRFDHLIRMERLADGLRDMFASQGAPADASSEVERLSRLNPSRAGDGKMAWTPRLRAIVEELYREDFEALGYGQTAVRRAA
jgi:hypothetical protein